MGHNGKSWRRRLSHWKNRPIKETCVYCLRRFRSRKERYYHERGCESAQTDDDIFECNSNDMVEIEDELNDF